MSSRTGGMMRGLRLNDILKSQKGDFVKKTEITNCPKWLLDAETEDENVVVIDGIVVWISGTWKGGTWESGTWKGGTWRYGTWNDGTWKGGTWNDGTWKGGTWKGGTWRNGSIQSKSPPNKV